ncbi:MAG: MATE family efflux transporter [Myxococcota bacterium]|nr:MATE family efflux transporter [Myxococcota bacterium]
MSEFRSLWKLAFPIVISQVGFVFMGLVDTVLVGRMFEGDEASTALSALSLGNTFFFGILIFGLGVIMSLDTWVSQAYGADDLKGCSTGLVQGIWLALGLTPFLVAAMWLVEPLLRAVGYDSDMVDLMEMYLAPLRWGVLPALLFKVYRCSLAAVNVTFPLVVAAVLANLANYILVLWFISGGLGIEALGVEGVAWSTSACRVVLFLPLFACVHFTPRFRHFPRPSLGPSIAVIRRLWVVGLPVGLQYFVEVGCFGGAAVLMGLLGTEALAAHQVALNIAALFFMVPMGVGAAAAVRTGQAYGAEDWSGVGKAGWTAIATAAGFALISASVLILGREPIVRFYGLEGQVFLLAVDFLIIAAVFQLGDGIQAVTLGVLRGLGDTRTPFFLVLAAWGLTAAPIGIGGAFIWSNDPRWIWYGLATGLVVVAILLTLRFALRLRSLPSDTTSPPSRDPGPWSSPG